jgi:hypothetical protein
MNCCPSARRIKGRDRLGRWCGWTLILYPSNFASSNGGQTIELFVHPTKLNSGFVGCGEERTASFAIDAVPIVTASYAPLAFTILRNYAIAMRPTRAHKLSLFSKIRRFDGLKLIPIFLISYISILNYRGRHQFARSSVNLLQITAGCA